MAYIALPEGVPGIRSLAMYRPESGQHLYELVQTLLRGDSPLTQAERELIASFVSSRNECKFCTDSHAAAARHLFKDKKEVVDFVLGDYASAPIGEKLRSLLTIAAKVQKSGHSVTE